MVIPAWADGLPEGEQQRQSTGGGAGAGDHQYSDTHTHTYRNTHMHNNNNNGCWSSQEEMLAWSGCVGGHSNHNTAEAELCGGHRSPQWQSQEQEAATRQHNSTFDNTLKCNTRHYSEKHTFYSWVPLYEIGSGPQRERKITERFHCDFQVEILSIKSPLSPLPQKKKKKNLLTLIAKTFFRSTLLLKFWLWPRKFKLIFLLPPWVPSRADGSSGPHETISTLKLEINKHRWRRPMCLCV